MMDCVIKLNLVIGSSYSGLPKLARYNELTALPEVCVKVVRPSQAIWVSLPNHTFYWTSLVL